jgi:uncharacterized protein DUF955
MSNQLSMFDQPTTPSENVEEMTPAAKWAEEATKHALDDLFNATFAYRTSKEFSVLMHFVNRFHFYSPYNALLIHIQKPGAVFVAPATRWKNQYKRQVKPNANPLVILQPMGPVMFVFDVSDTEAGPDSIPLPKEVVNPFEPRKGKIGGELYQTIENAKRDGILIQKKKSGSQAAGSIQLAKNENATPLLFQVGKDKNKKPIYEQIPVRYDLLLNEDLSRESQYATLVHELAHLYCGHLGTPNKKWWPNSGV